MCAEDLPAEASLKPTRQIADVVAMRMGQDNARKLFRRAVAWKVAREGELLVIVFALGGAAVHGVDVAAGLDLEEMAGAGDRRQGTMEL